jgi:hypothetical protein
MTVESFYETLKFAVEVDVRLRLQTSLEAIRDTLNSLVTSPAHPQQQSSLASALKTFTSAAEALDRTLTPSQASSLADAGGAEFFDPRIAEKVKAAVASNAMTPSVARDFVQDLANRRANYLLTVEQTLSGLGSLGVSSQELTPGTVSLAFVIPRELYDNELESFAKELKFISHLIEHFGEAVTGEAEPVFLEGPSSSIPTIAVAASAKVTESIATVVSKFLESWEKAEKVRRIRQELFDMGLKKQTFDDLTEQIRATVDEVIEDSIQITLSNYNGDKDPIRRQQLESALRQDTRRLFGQIERGLTIQFRARISSDADQSDRIALEAVDRMSREMQFPPVASEPMLLTRGQVLEGDFDSIVVPKKTPAPHQPATNGVQPAPLAAAAASSGGGLSGGLWSRRRTDR